MKKLLIQLDTDPYYSVFDTVVAYDSGTDHVIGHSNVTPDNVRPLVEGAIFTRSMKQKKNTALFIGGSDMSAGEKLFSAVQKMFFSDFRVSIMLDSNGSNTTAAAAVTKLLTSGPIKDKRVVILAGTGPVGSRAAVMLAQEGASKVIISSRQLKRAEQVCQNIKQNYGVDITPAEAKDSEERTQLIENAEIVFAAGAAGVELLQEHHWQDNKTIEMMIDANASPPIGIGGTNMMDKGQERHGKIAWGAIGFGALKISLHRLCISKLFETNTQVLDAEEIFNIAKNIT